MAERDPQIGKQGRPTADSDFAAWIHDQVAALREGRFADLDIDDLADEVESLAKRDFKKLRSALRIILLHMLQWDYQPERRGQSWRNSINNGRERVWGELASSPSFRQRLSSAVQEAYPLARLKAWEETGVFKLGRGRSCARTAGTRSCSARTSLARTGCHRTRMTHSKAIFRRKMTESSMKG